MRIQIIYMHKIESKSSLSKQDTPNTTSTKKRQLRSNQKNLSKQSPITNFYRDGNNTTDISPSQSSNCRHTQTFVDSRSKPKNMNSDMQMHLQMKNTRIKNKQGSSSSREPLEKKSLRSKDFREVNRHEEQLINLQIQNQKLKKQIIEFKVSQFYQFDDEKLKELITQVEQLKGQIKRYQEQIQSLKLENDFLNRANYQLKLQLQRNAIKQFKTNDNLQILGNSEMTYDLGNETSSKQLTPQKKSHNLYPSRLLTRAKNTKASSTPNIFPFSGDIVQQQYFRENMGSEMKSSLHIEQAQKMQKPTFRTSSKDIRKKMNKVYSNQALLFSELELDKEKNIFHQEYSNKNEQAYKMGSKKPIANSQFLTASISQGNKASKDPFFKN